jgi:hypothetical protein
VGCCLVCLHPSVLPAPVMLASICHTSFLCHSSSAIRPCVQCPHSPLPAPTLICVCACLFACSFVFVQSCWCLIGLVTYIVSIPNYIPLSGYVLHLQYALGVPKNSKLISLQDTQQKTYFKCGCAMKDEGECAVAVLCQCDTYTHTEIKGKNGNKNNNKNDKWLGSPYHNLPAEYP